jgi:hypothetical protein
VVEALVNTCEMVDPEPADAPVNSPELVETVQANVVPETLFVNTMFGAVPEQIRSEAGVAVATGLGLTVITTVIGVPGQELADGVMV